MILVKNYVDVLNSILFHVLAAEHKHKEVLQEREIFRLKNVELKQSYQTLSLLRNIGKNLKG